MPKLDKEDVYWLLDKLIQDRWRYRDQRSSVKKWCISVWLAVIVAISSGEFELSLFGAILLIYAPLLFFWVLEGIYGTIDTLHSQHVSELEARLAEERFEFDVPSDVFFDSRNQRFSLREKIKFFFSALFFAETIFAMYLLLALVSVFFLVSFSAAGVL